MRSRNRSILERPDRIETVDDAFLDALRSDDGVVRWSSVADLRDLGRRLAAWRLSVVAEPEACAQVTFRLVAPTVAEASETSNLWRLELAARPTTVAAFRALGAACRVWQPLCGMTDDVLMLEQSEMEAFLRVGAPALKAAGYGVEVPARLAAEIVAEAVISPQKETKAAMPAADAKLRAKVTIRVAGEVVTREEIAFLLEQGTSMVFFRGRWIEVDRALLVRVRARRLEALEPVHQILRQRRAQRLRRRRAHHRLAVRLGADLPRLHPQRHLRPLAGEAPLQRRGGRGGGGARGGEREQEGGQEGEAARHGGTGGGNGGRLSRKAPLLSTVRFGR